MIRFDPNIPENLKSILTDEYDEYMDKYGDSLTSNEKRQLNKWVSTGHSVYESPGSKYFCDMFYPEPDFIDTYRMDKDIDDSLKGLSAAEKSKFLDEMIPERNPLGMPYLKTKSEKLCWLDNKARDLNAVNEMYKGFIDAQGLTAQFEAWCRFSF